MDPVNLTVEMRDVYQKPKKRQGSSGSSPLPVERKKSKHCSMLVKSLVLVIVLLVLCCLVLLSLYLIERDRNSRPEETMISVNSTTQTSKQQSHYGGLCWSRDCLQAASDLLNSIDPSVDPCEDFYQYACGGWLKKNPLTPGKFRWNQFEKLSDENGKLVEKILTDKELRAIYSKEEAVWKALAYYESCLDKDEIEKLKGKPLERLIQQYGSWSITDKSWKEEDWELITNLARIHKYLALPIFFTTTVAIDNKNSSQYIITMRESSIAMSRRQHLTNDTESHRIREAFKDLMRNLTKKLGAVEGSEDDLMKTFEFEKELAKISTSPFMMVRFEQAYRKLTISKLQKYTGAFINWTDYFKRMMEENQFKVTDQTEIVVYALEYLKNLVKLLKITPKRTVANYVMWRVVNSKYLSLSSDFVELLKSYYIQAFNHWSESDDKMICQMRTMREFGVPISKVFLDQKFYGDSRKTAMDMTADVRAAFVDILMRQDWMDDETKKAAKLKAEYLSENIGYPDYIVDVKYLTEQYKEVKIDPKTFFDNHVSAERNTNLRILAKAGTVVDKSQWQRLPTETNAFYSYPENKVVFPAAILQPPFYNVRYPSAINYGAIGGVMAHELTHGFDNNGKMFDIKGNRRKWWSNETLVNFERKSVCLVDQYSNFTFYGRKVDGKKTLSENIADGGGVTVALEAYRKWVKEHWEEPRLPGMMLTNEQVFFISFARNWCGHYSERAISFAAKFDVHSPKPWRVNGTLMNSPEFSKAFNCPLGSPMNPKKKCKVW